MNYTRESAETVALKCLGWLISNDELMPVFMGATGAGEDDLRRGAADPEFLGAVLDFLTMNDEWVVDFCRDAGLPNDAPLQARAMLPGGQVEHWT
ncbi:DUF3572 domain-containing protein [Roseovarius nanhaiticus]|uniref:DUF3572 domain-containing protein n=1 Tax=Roseovarius nanhaiticus TaxID=573024 RepID=A0A1N7FFZ4_9RHOB|nr:DUF3572 domain-containing protein [Roseovarius nanhaiticus]SEK55456.1 Protein of unknown function [Roseovarius nanhaiticus]SIR99242.1 Protein of unknown function [Roseovarius nanhaiticus]